jgi:hypothetical protein
MPRIILATDPEAVPLIRAMELAHEPLVEVVRIADHERTFCTSNDIAGFDLITVHAKAARALRDILCNDRWIKDEKDNQPGILNSHLKIRVIPCNFDQNAGSFTREPTNRHGKGEASRSKTRCNGTGWIPGLPDIPAQEGMDIVTWLLGIYSEHNQPLKAELSLPVGFDGAYYTRLSQRIILLTGEEGPELIGIRRGPDSEGPVEVEDIAIKRR